MFCRIMKFFFWIQKSFPLYMVLWSIPLVTIWKMPPDATKAMKIPYVTYGKDISNNVFYNCLTLLLKWKLTDFILHPSLVLQVVSECVYISRCIIQSFMNEVISKSYEKSEGALGFLLPAWIPYLETTKHKPGPHKWHHEFLEVCFSCTF